MLKTKIIAEIANAHQGDVYNLKELIIEAAKAGADAVKFQWYKYDSIATPDYEWYEAYAKLFINEVDWEEIIQMTMHANLEIWIDNLDNWGLEMARKHLGNITGFKIPRMLTQSEFFMKEILTLNKPILLEVGGWYDWEIEQILQYIQSLTNVPVTLLYGFRGYPTDEEDINLARLIYIKERFKCEVGLADHEEAGRPLAIDLPVHAYFAGATVIEKHLTLNRALLGYDYYSSLQPSEFRQMVVKLRQAEVIMGNRTVNEAQRNYFKDAFNVVANQDIREGEVITFEKVMYKKSSDSRGYKPVEFERDLPLISKKNLTMDQCITPQDVEQLKVFNELHKRLDRNEMGKLIDLIRMNNLRK
ncbi:N-acetylneuraminate synthase family protein [Bacillus sp. AGMB 02131]|uniref:N-acetylneuraminate synthase family protein n=1 Tax=Peribacillus faecalis TaxID=2772559 RepID=A0A927HCK4_9BACI|nr:N-acetylneuraminate synthase family protein [Peribacillus faecalis]MBD3109656.1 N-acetylneuraminate synthase family protein [Peribacillus faecalis]